MPKSKPPKPAPTAEERKRASLERRLAKAARGITATTPQEVARLSAKLQVRLTQAQLTALRAKAAAADMELVEFARSHLVTLAGATITTPAAKPKKAPPPPALAVSDVAVYQELRRQGVNLNQIAHALNTYRMPAPPELGPLLGDIRLLIAASIRRGAP